MIRSTLNIKRTVKGYSLTEVLFNMILIAIVISAGYLGFEYTLSDVNLFDKANNDVQPFVELSNALKIDQERNKMMYLYDNELTFASTGNQQTVYSFNENLVVRSNETHNDTFRLKIKSIEGYADGIPTLGGIEKAEIKTESGGKLFELVVLKRYDAFTKLNLKHGD